MSTTTAATEARRAATEEMLQRLTLVLRQMRREHAAVTVAAVARRAAVSRTFLYQNARARTLLLRAHVMLSAFKYLDDKPCSRLRHRATTQ